MSGNWKSQPGSDKARNQVGQKTTQAVIKLVSQPLKWDRQPLHWERQPPSLPHLNRHEDIKEQASKTTSQPASQVWLLNKIMLLARYPCWSVLSACDACVVFAVSNLHIPHTCRRGYSFTEERTVQYSSVHLSTVHCTVCSTIQWTL